MNLVAIDSDVFIIHLRYPRDIRFSQNEKFLNLVKKKKIKGACTFFNVLEVCGILSYNLSPQNLFELYVGFIDYFGVKVLFPAHAQGEFLYDFPGIFSAIQKKQSLGDAQIAQVLDKFAHQIEHFVTWNATHFRGKTNVPALTPEETLKVRSKWLKK